MVDMSIANIKSEYDQTLDYLYSFVDYSLTRQLRYSPEKFNLDRMKALMLKLGDPQFKYPVIHIAGTKGKGSTAVFIASVLQSAGYKVGLYTSPHLHDYVERIQVNRVPISHEGLVEEVNVLKMYLPDIPEITTFEITTAIAFRYFEENNVDIAVIEVGLGGRLDATNIVNPLVSVITSLSYDHMNVLGDTIEKIAFEKAGIIKKNHPVVVAQQVYKQTYDELRKIAKERNSPYIQIDQKLSILTKSHSLEGQEFEIRELANPGKGKTYHIPLLGFHQIQNAATAYCVLTEIEGMGFSIGLKDIQQGFKNANWPCRFELIKKKPLIIVDSAHNGDSAQKLSSTVRDYLANRQITLIFGASEDKDIKAMFTSLLPISDVIIMTKSVHPRAMEPKQLQDIAREMGRESYSTESIEKAIDLALGIKNNNVILVTGSIFVAAAAKEIIQKLNQDKP